MVLTHGGGEDYDPQDVHSIAGAWPGFHQHVGGWGQVQRKVLDVGSIVALDTVDEGPSGAGLREALAHRGRYRFHRDLGTCLILSSSPGETNKQTNKHNGGC